MKQKFVSLTTPFEESEKRSFFEYPRKQLERESYFPLDGLWELSVKRGGKISYVGKIKMPFAPESRLSGICRTLKRDEKWIYTRRFELPQGFSKGRVLLNFGAVDQIARVCVNSHAFSEHIGGYLPFTLDITDCLTEGINILYVEVEDSLDPDIPYGKQRKRRGGMWYTPISGIWQTVWIESVTCRYVSQIKATPSLTGISFHIEGGDIRKRIDIDTPGGMLSFEFEGADFQCEIPDARLWSPEDPYLYRFTLYCGEDTVKSYFALRTVEVGRHNEKEQLLLNGKPYFFHGLLDQGYFSDGIYLPASPEGYEWDIKAAKILGFNMLRKHIKIEPDLFYYYCDLYGIVVFQDMVNNGRYSFLIDTALPTVGPRRGITHRASRRRREIFEKHCADTLDHLYNHPSVCYYTVFNEGWGQYDADRLYSKLKKLDPTRVFDSTSGWFHEKQSDVQSEHVYFKKADFKIGERPAVLSEFGGYSCRTEGHIFNLNKEYGYKTMNGSEELSRSLESLYTNEVIPLIRQGLCASVLTQLSDVEDEINGLVTYDRRVVKPHYDTMRNIRREIDKAMSERE